MMMEERKVTMMEESTTSAVDSPSKVAAVTLKRLEHVLEMGATTRSSTK